ncbi:MAG: ComF family protein [Gammaproteobacteria bacterium]|nr:ComF family protein [Gammaproteobacteria bacterium]MDH3464996.1 ComF family protein [Gammaproteobacteria bacterium]
MITRILEYVFPRYCCLCGDPTTSTTNFCHGCLDDLPWVENACPRCATPLQGPGVCGVCQRSAPFYTRSIAALRYSWPVNRIVHAMKYQGQLDAVDTLAALMALKIEGQIARIPQQLIPVPLHPRRLRTRGFNQSLELARRLANRFQVIANSESVIRRVDTRPQTDFDGERRRRNMRDAFLATGSIYCKHVAIVDDVMTSGATCDELAKTLVGAGAIEVDVWAVARADFVPRLSTARTAGGPHQ